MKHDIKAETKSTKEFLSHPALRPSNDSKLSSVHKLAGLVPKHARLVFEDSEFPKIDEALSVILKSLLNYIIQGKGMN